MFLFRYSCEEVSVSQVSLGFVCVHASVFSTGGHMHPAVILAPKFGLCVSCEGAGEVAVTRCGS